MKYFAYGSNMLRQRLRSRIPSSYPIGIARLPSHRLAWHKEGKDGSGKCDIIANELDDSSVWGVLFEIAPTEKDQLDKFEGCGHGYEDIIISVEFEGQDIKALTYKATRKNSYFKPFDWYKGLVLAGAKENLLPEDYVKKIEATDVVIDQNEERRKKNFSIMEDNK